MENIPPEPDNIIKRQHMINAITQGVYDEDYEFVVEIASHQDLLRPFEIVEYIDVKRRNAEDPVENRRWEDALGYYLDSIADSDFPEEEEEAIHAVVERLEFDRTVDNPDIADDPSWEQEEPERSDSDADIDWRNDFFQHKDITQERLSKLAENPIGRSVANKCSLALSTRNATHIESALEIIQEFSFGSSDELRKLVDVYLYSFAEDRAKLAISTRNSTHFEMALDAVSRFGSDEDVIQAMESALDKYAFEYAKDRVALAASTRNNNHIKQAVETLDQFVSTPERISAMLAELGLA